MVQIVICFRHKFILWEDVKMLNLFTKKRRNKGFTLIELITVIAILGILAAIGFMSMGGYRDSANSTVDAANAKLLSNVAAMINADTGYYPGQAGAPASVPVWTATFSSITPAQAAGLIEDEIFFKGKNGTFTYNIDTGKVETSASGGGSTPTAPVLTGITISTAGTNVQTPTITLPALAAMPAGVTGIDWTENSSRLSISSSDVLTVTRDMSTQTTTFRLTATWSGGTVTRDFNITIPSWNGTWPELTIN
jgi:prepilin-type N-terminal cleavage/methylation domain-containing protein